jgi:hypothetical protein
MTPETHETHDTPLPPSFHIVQKVREPLVNKKTVLRSDLFEGQPLNPSEPVRLTDVYLSAYEYVLIVKAQRRFRLKLAYKQHRRKQTLSSERDGIRRSPFFVNKENMKVLL